MRVVHDSVHGTYQLHDILWIIIDSPEFQRLRKIKQTGNTYRVYPGAVHTRFEHSLGTAYLCRSLCDKLKHIEDKDMMCLQIASLCHDLGHCAFSHLFDTIASQNSLELVLVSYVNFDFFPFERAFLNVSNFPDRLAKYQ